MKRYSFIFLVLSITFFPCEGQSERVFIFTDINIDQGDPDDRQSLVHLLWYANELQIEGIVPDRWSARGLEACLLAMDAYAKDYELYDFDKKGYMTPSRLTDRIAVDIDDAEHLLTTALSDTTSPLYILVWGNMRNAGNLISGHVDKLGHIRLITIGTNLMIEEYRQHLPATWPATEKPCEQYNWNGFGRDELYHDPRFKALWWLEINWTYEGMFSGEEPAQMYQELSHFGHLGEHMIEVTKNQPWARYFRVGDTPSVLYVIDPGNDPDDPTLGSWAGRFIKPFPAERPHYYTDYNGPVEWNYADPCETWENHRAMRDYAKSTLEKERPAMYEALLTKLRNVYDTNGGTDE